MTSDLAFTIFRLGYLALLWILVFGAVAVLRRDIFGAVVTPRGKGQKDAAARKRAFRKEREIAGATAQPRALLVTGGTLVGTIIPLASSPITIGRAPACSLVLEDEYASSRHAQLSPSSDGWIIEDLGSRNGTFVDDERLTQAIILQPGTTVRIGQTTVELVG